MPLILHNHYHYTDKNLFELLLLTQTNISKIMAKLEELQAALADLQTTVDNKQAEIIAEIQSLKDQIANGGEVTDEDLDGLIATVNSIKTDLETTDLS